MPIFSVENDRTCLTPAERTTFSALDIRERQDLQRLLRDHPAELESIIGETLLVFCEEYDVWNNSRNRIDLLALDKSGNLVVIELKITEDGGHSDLQALRYAAMIRSISFEQVVAAYQGFLRDQLGRAETEVESAESELRFFLGKSALDEVQFSNAPRIILMSAGFSTEIITTALYLIEQGLAIECYTAQPYALNNQILLSFDRLLPVQTVDIVTPGDAQPRPNPGPGATRTRTRPNAVAYLEDLGVLTPGTRLHLISELRPRFLPPEPDRVAIFVGNRKFQGADQETYAISALCRAICEKHHVPVGSGAFQGPLHWAIEGSEKTLDALRDEYLLQTQAAPPQSAPQEAE